MDIQIVPPIGLSSEEIMELSEVVGYPVFTRICMGELRHRFVLLQDGAAAIIVNDKGEILLQSRADRDEWGLPGGCQDLGENLKTTATRELYEETGIKVTEEELVLIDTLSGESRKRMYPNGDIVYNNTSLYLVNINSKEINLNIDSESINLEFFDINNLPESMHDDDLINEYIKFLKK